MYKSTERGSSLEVQVLHGYTATITSQCSKAVFPSTHRQERDYHVDNEAAPCHDFHSSLIKV